MLKVTISNLALFYCLILLSGCENQSVSTLEPIKFDDSISSIELTKPFTLTLADNHPTELAIASPDNQWFYLQGKDIKKTYMQADEFKHAKSLTIDPKSLKAIQWVEGKSIVSPVFTAPGIYEIYLSDNLETEPDNALTFIKKVKLVIKL